VIRYGVFKLIKIVYDDRAGKLGTLALGCAAAIFDPARQKVLLVRRLDNGLWCLPGGHMEAGESVAEACAREVFEETGLHIQIGKLIGVYSDPHRRVDYPDGRRVQSVVLTFEAQPIGGELRHSNETSAYGWFSPAEIDTLELMDGHRARIADAFADQEAAFVH
jgi:ADP-ribose pyrophosphatase YjhB (NUDIX family)